MIGTFVKGIFFVVCFCGVGIVYAQTAASGTANQTAVSVSAQGKQVSGGQEASSPNIDKKGETKEDVLVSEEGAVTPGDATNSTKVKSVSSVSILTEGKKLKEKLVVSGPVFSTEQE